MSLLCPVSSGLLNLQVHGDRNSMMQNCTYNSIDQGALFSFLNLWVLTYFPSYFIPQRKCKGTQM